MPLPDFSEAYFDLDTLRGISDKLIAMTTQDPSKPVTVPQIGLEDEDYGILSLQMVTPIAAAALGAPPIEGEEFSRGYFTMMVTSASPDSSDVYELLINHEGVVINVALIEK